MSHEEKSRKRSRHEVLLSLEVRPIWRNERSLWDELIRQYHYLGLHSLVGESIRYIALFEGEWLALMGWSAAALKSKVRDQWHPGGYPVALLASVATPSPDSQ